MELLVKLAKGRALSTLRLLPLLLLTAAFAGCAAPRLRSAEAPSASQQAAEQRIILSPWLVSGEYFRERAPQPAAFDAQETKRSEEDLRARQASVEERVARLEGAAAGAAASPPQGYIVKVDGRQVFTDLGAREPGLAVGAKLSILAERDLVHPVSGRVLGRTLEEIARASVVQVEENFSRAEIEAIVAGATVRPKDRVGLRRP